MDLFRPEISSHHFVPSLNTLTGRQAYGKSRCRSRSCLSSSTKSSKLIFGLSVVHRNEPSDVRAPLTYSSTYCRILCSPSQSRDLLPTTTLATAQRSQKLSVWYRTSSMSCTCVPSSTTPVPPLSPFRKFTIPSLRTNVPSLRS